MSSVQRLSRRRVFLCLASLNNVALNLSFLLQILNWIHFTCYQSHLGLLAQYHYSLPKPYYDDAYIPSFVTHLGHLWFAKRTTTNHLRAFLISMILRICYISKISFEWVADCHALPGSTPISVSKLYFVFIFLRAASNCWEVKCARGSI